VAGTRNAARRERQALKSYSEDSSFCSGVSLVALGKLLNVFESMSKIITMLTSHGCGED
jgi:hypothetical protein